MYNKLKQLLKAIIPKRFLFTYELKFRFFYYQFYRGKGYQCNICQKELRKFIHGNDGDKLCPYCGSLSRNRRLWNILESEFLKDNMKILDFSPSRCLYRVLKRHTSISYTSTDLSGDFLADRQYDITNIDSQNDTYDLIICYHILEHIENDNKAMRELFRILRHGGSCLVQTPFKKGDTLEDFSLKSREERLK
jgi:hypothetical protein